LRVILFQLQDLLAVDLDGASDHEREPVEVEQVEAGGAQLALEGQGEYGVEIADPQLGAVEVDDGGHEKDAAEEEGDDHEYAHGQV